MDLVALMRIALRRWRLLVPLLVLSGGLGFLASVTVAPTYQVDGLVRVAFPFSTNETAARFIQSNPYYDTYSAALVLGQAGASVDLANDVAAAGGGAAFVVDASVGRSIIVVTVTGPDEAETIETYGIVVRELQQRLDLLQEDKDIPAPYRITADDVAKPQNAALSTSSRTKVLIASVALGGMLSLALALVVDHRQRTRAAAAPVRDGEDGPDAGTGPEPGSGPVEAALPEPTGAAVESPAVAKAEAAPWFESPQPRQGAGVRDADPATEGAAAAPSGGVAVALAAEEDRPKPRPRPGSGPGPDGGETSAGGPRP